MRLRSENIISSLLHSTIYTQNNCQYNDNCVTDNLSNKQLHNAHFSCSLKDLETTKSRVRPRFVCKIPLLARRTRPKGRQSAARDDRAGYLVYKRTIRNSGRLKSSMSVILTYKAKLSGLALLRWLILNSYFLIYP